MKEKFKKIRTAGTINVKLKDTGNLWVADKAVIMQNIVNIANSYNAQGYRLTLRQLYYQLVAKDLIPNHDTVYKKISALKDDCVYGGYLDWSIFEDRGRVPKIAYHEKNIKEALKKTESFYRLDRQLGQPNHIEVWTEKDAISDILNRVTNPLTIRLVVNKGYSSSTAMYGAYCRFMRSIAEGKKIVLLYFGDHDPSGLDMVRDIQERIIFFMGRGKQKADFSDYILDWLRANETMITETWEYHEDDYLVKIDGKWVMDLYRIFFEHHFKIKHIGLTMEQIQKYDPPHNPAKITDPRAKDYVRKFGQKSWEVDALTPSVMTDIVQEAIDDEMDMGIYYNLIEKEKADKTKLKSLIKKIK